MDKTKTIEERAADTLQKRIRGSFGYRAAESVVNGFDPLENITVFKAHGGLKDTLEGSLDLFIERAKPQVTAKEIADDMAVDTGEAQAILDEENTVYDAIVKDRDHSLKTLERAYDKAPAKYTELSQFSADNFRRVVDNLERSARAQYVRSRNTEWVTAIKGVTATALTELAKYAPQNEAQSDEVAA